MIGVKRCIVVADMNPNKLNEEIHITLGRIKSIRIEDNSD